MKLNQTLPKGRNRTNKLVKKFFGLAFQKISGHKNCLLLVVVSITSRLNGEYGIFIVICYIDSRTTALETIEGSIHFPKISQSWVHKWLKYPLSVNAAFCFFAGLHS